MKNKIIFPFLLFCAAMTASVARATIWTVSNHPISIAQYTELQAAVDAAQAGDTIYVHPSQILYNVAEVSKPLTFIGPGTRPEGTGGLYAYVNVLSFGDGSGGSVVKGLRINSIQLSGNQSAGYLIERNHIGNIYLGSGFGDIVNGVEIRNNILTDSFGIWAGMGPIVNMLVVNNIVYGGLGQFGDTPGSNNIAVLNNIIVSNNSDVNPISYIHNATISHNIIYGGNSLYSVPNDWCVITHNLFYGDYILEEFIGLGTTEAGNILGPDQDPLFVESSQLNANYFYFQGSAPYPDLHLQPGSPAVGASQGGLDIGLYAGPSPWPDNPIAQGQWRYYPGATMPELFHMTGPGTTAPDTPVQITIKGKNAN